MKLLGNQSQKTKKRHREILLFNRSFTDWKHLPEGAIGIYHSKKRIFKTRVRKVKTDEGK
jgi:hypothetical protein